MKTLEDFSNFLQFSLKDFKKYQLKELKTFVKHISKSSPYYKKILAGHAQITSYEDFEKLPLLDSKVLREIDIDEIRGAPWEDILTVTRSSGTTGKAKIVLWDRKGMEKSEQWGSLGFMIQGVKPGSRFAFMRPFEMSRGRAWCDELEDVGAVTIPIGRIRNEIETDDAIDKIVRLKATYLSATSARIMHLTKRVIELGYDPAKDFCVTHIMVGGHVLQPSVRAYLAKTWQADIYDKVGSNEMGHMGFDCKEHNGFHILPGPNYLEVLNLETGKPVTNSNEVGEIVATGFLNVGTPLLRYRIGDIGTISYEPCACGLNFPRIFFKGRIGGTIAFGGTKLYDTEIDAILARYKTLSTNYQVTIEDLKGVTQATMRIECADPKAKISLKEKQQALESIQKISSTVYEKILSRNASIEIILVAQNTLARSSGDKIANQFDDKRM